MNASIDLTQQNHMWHRQRSQRDKCVSKGRLIDGCECIQRPDALIHTAPAMALI